MSRRSVAQAACLGYHFVRSYETVPEFKDCVKHLQRPRLASAGQGKRGATIWRVPQRVKWSIDSADAYSVAKVRRAVVDALRTMTSDKADLFTVETVLGELLGAEMERGHLALVITVENGVGGPAVHVYTQGRPRVSSTYGELRNAILQATRVPMSIEVSAQGTHVCIRVPMDYEMAANTELWQAAAEFTRDRIKTVKGRLDA